MTLELMSDTASEEILSILTSGNTVESLISFIRDLSEQERDPFNEKSLCVILANFTSTEQDSIIHLLLYHNVLEAFSFFLDCGEDARDLH